jgi:hypothetical protein
MLWFPQVLLVIYVPVGPTLKGVARILNLGGQPGFYIGEHSFSKNLGGQELQDIAEASLLQFFWEAMS